MAQPKWLRGRTLKTRPDRPDDPPLPAPEAGGKRRQEPLSPFQRKVAREAQAAPARRERMRRNHERILAARRAEVHPVESTQSLAVRLYEAYKSGTMDVRPFGDLDNRRSIFGTLGAKERWWNVAEEARKAHEELFSTRAAGCIRP